MTDSIASLPPKPLPAASQPTGTPGLENESVGQFWSTDEGATFAEFLDIINPLQHIPVVSTIYRAITGDEIGHGPRAIGGFLFGGPAGAIAAGVVGLIEEASGGDVGSHLASLVDELTGGDGTNDEAAAAQIAQTTPAQTLAAQTQAGQTAAIAAPEAAPEMPLEIARQMANQIALAASVGSQSRGFAVAAPGGGAGAQATALSNALSGNLNRIAFNPAAALGVPTGGPAGSQGASQAVTQAAGQITGRSRAEPNAAAATAQSRMPFFPARPLGVPFAAHTPAAEPLPAAPARQEAPPAKTTAATSAPATRLQADALLAKWASQQMQIQKGDTGNGQRASDPAEDTNPTAAAHPMLPPDNASPEWFASAMGAALNRYQAGMNTQPRGTGSGLTGAPIPGHLSR